MPVQRNQQGSISTEIVPAPTFYYAEALLDFSCHRSYGKFHFWGASFFGNKFSLRSKNAMTWIQHGWQVFGQSRLWRSGVTILHDQTTLRAESRACYSASRLGNKTHQKVVGPLKGGRLYRAQSYHFWPVNIWSILNAADGSHFCWMVTMCVLPRVLPLSELSPAVRCQAKCTGLLWFAPLGCGARHLWFRGAVEGFCEKRMERRVHVSKGVFPASSSIPQHCL